MYMKTNPKLWNVVLIYLNTTFKSTLRNSTKFELNKSNAINLIFAFKDGSYYCYCAHVLPISRYSEHPSPFYVGSPHPGEEGGGGWGEEDEGPDQRRMLILDLLSRDHFPDNGCYPPCWCTACVNKQRLIDSG